MGLLWYNPDFIMTNMAILPSLLTEESLKKVVKTWFTELLYHDIVAVIGYPQNNTRMIFLDIIGNRQLLLDNDIHPDNYLFISVDFNVEHLDEAVDLEKFILNKLRQYHVYTSNEDTDLQSLLKIIKSQVVIAAFGCERLIERRKTGLLQWISMMSNYTSMKTLMFFETDIFSDGTKRFFSGVSEFHPHIFFHRLLSAEDSKQYIDHLCAKWDLTVSEQKKQDVIQNCGGHFILIKEVLRYLFQNPDGTIESAYRSFDLQFALLTFYNSFRNDKPLINQIALGNGIQEDFQPESMRYLMEVGIVRHDQNTVKLAIPLLNSYVQEELSNLKKLNLNKNQIYVNDVPVSVNFSKREQRILSELIENPKKLFPRDDIARILWPKAEEGNYSDWALDSHISRIRRKLIAVGLPKAILVTKKGQGIYLNK